MHWVPIDVCFLFTYVLQQTLTNNGSSPAPDGPLAHTTMRTGCWVVLLWLWVVLCIMLFGSVMGAGIQFFFSKSKAIWQWPAPNSSPPQLVFCRTYYSTLSSLCLHTLQGACVWAIACAVWPACLHTVLRSSDWVRSPRAVAIRATYCAPGGQTERFIIFR